MMDKPRTNCKGCEERHTGCHSSCPKYREYVEENNKRKDVIFKANQIEREQHCYDVLRIQRLTRRKK